MKKLFFTAVLLVVSAQLFAQKTYTLQSPNGELKAEVEVGAQVTYSVLHEGEVMIEPSPISMTLTDGTVWGDNAKVIRTYRDSESKQIETPFYKHSTLKDEYNELTLRFRGDYRIVVRAYDEAIAYRFVSTSKRPFCVQSEEATFQFPEDYNAYISYIVPGKTTKGRKYNNIYESQYTNSFENYYTHTPLQQWDAEKLAHSPLLVEAGDKKRVLIMESDLLNYPGMYLSNADSNQRVEGMFATYPKEIEQGGHNMLQALVTAREEFIAQCDKGRAFPWRIIQVAESDAELADNNMVYKLATPSRIADTSWIKPGKVMWDWWCYNNIYGVDFRAGINTATYKYFIDAAAEGGVEYIMLDEGWAVNLKADLMQVDAEIDLPELVRYGESRGVDVLLWAGYYAFHRDMEQVCKHYSEMGIKGFKVDFMDRDDQPMVSFYEEAAQMASRYNLLLDFHGAFKPTGLSRTYPNVVNYEAVKGMEQLKWSNSSDQVTYETMIPFIRMAAGSLDYTQGAMRNATKRNFRPVNCEPMSQGTRTRQLALYTIFESPLNMLCDSPTNYKQEAECFQYIASVPTVWDETKILSGKVGEHIAIARRSGEEWYVGAITNWDAREMTIDLSFLGDGRYQVELFTDGINADRVARDYRRESLEATAQTKLNVKLLSGGGCAMRILKL